MACFFFALFSLSILADDPMSRAGAFAEAYVVGKGDVALEFAIMAYVGHLFISCHLRLTGLEYLAGYLAFNGDA